MKNDMDNILLTGKTGLFPDEALRYIAETRSVLVTGRSAQNYDGSLPETVRFLATDPQDSDFSRAFELGAVRTVWHVNACADGGKPVDESAKLETILRLCAESRVERLIVLTESMDPVDYRELIRRWGMPEGDLYPVQLAVVRLPLLSGTGTGRGRLDRIFTAMRQNRVIRLDSGDVRSISVLPVQELTALLLRMSGESWFRPGIYAADGKEGSLESLREILLSLRPDAQILLSEDEAGPEERPADRGQRQHVLRFRIPVTRPDSCDGQLGRMYRLPVTVDWRNEIAARFAKTQGREAGSSTGRRLLFGLGTRFGRTAGMLLDLAVVFLLSELLSRITSESVYFKIVDVRLLFVIIMGMTHGLVAGSLAAVLECVMLVIRYSEIGISGLLLFYNVENWIPFVYYLTAGVITGIGHQKKEQRIRSVTAENELIRSKYLFLNEAYRTSVSERSALRAQILGEEESYARIYGAVKSMNQRTPEAVCVESVRVLRRLLENETVSIYEVDPLGMYAQLLSCCRENASRITMDLEDFPQMTQTLSAGEVWKNTRFVDGAPMYAQLVRYSRRAGDGELRDLSYIVTVEQAGQDQLSSWYAGHFSILCGLFQDALESASLRERVIL